MTGTEMPESFIGVETAIAPMPIEVVTHLVRQHDVELKEQSRQIARLDTRMDDMSGDVKAIKTMMEDGRARDNQRDGAIKFTIWLANFLGGGGTLAVGVALYHLWVK